MPMPIDLHECDASDHIFCALLLGDPYRQGFVPTRKKVPSNSFTRRALSNFMAGTALPNCMRGGHSNCTAGAVYTYTKIIARRALYTRS